MNNSTICGRLGPRRDEMNKRLVPLLLPIILISLSAGCGGRDVPSRWSQGPESLAIEICPNRAGDPDLARRGMLTAAALFHRLKFGVHSVDTRSLVVHSGYGVLFGVVTAWRFQIQKNGRAWLVLAKSSPEHTGNSLLRAEDVAASIASRIGRHSCRPIDNLEKMAAEAGVVLPKVLPEATRTAPLREAIPAPDKTVQERATESASEESTASPADSDDAGPPPP